MDCKKPLYVLAEFSIILLPLIIFSKFKVINFIIPILLSFIISAELSYFITFSETITPVILSSIPQTNISMGTQVASPLLKFFIPLFIIISLLCWKVSKEFQIITYKKKLIICFILFLVSCLGITKMLEKHANRNDNKHFYEILADRSIRGGIIYFREPFMERFPLIIGNTLYLVGDFLDKVYINSNNSHNTWPTGIILNKDNDAPTKIIIVLGESSLPEHHSLYGYPYQTTPHLDLLHKNNQLTLFNQAITSIPNTNESIRLTFSYATATNPEPFYQHKNSVEMAKLAGYQTIWLSSVIESGLYGSYTAMIASSSERFLSPDSDHRLLNQNDLALPPIFDSLYEKGKKQFFILHLQGSHTPYNWHYDEQDKVLVTTPEHTDYDRTIYHTDRMLGQLIDNIKKHNEDAILIYFSDHGEIVNLGHGFSFNIAPIIQYHVPLIVYQQGKARNIQSLIDKYRDKHGVFNLVNMIYVINELQGYNIANPVIKQAKKDGELILKTNLKAYDFEELRKLDEQENSKDKIN